MPIGAVAYGYGDAPATYDLEKGTVSTAAGSTLLSGLYLGITAPSTEPAVKVSADADGDGTEEDGLVDPQPVIAANVATYRVKVTNNTDSVAYISGFVDYNGNGNLLESNERSGMITVPANSGLTQYDLVFSNMPATGVPPTSFMRLRLSTDQDAASQPYGASPQGEVEDYLVKASLDPLPIQLVTFAARTQSCDVAINWTVANADKFSKFMVERSSDGLKYNTAGVVDYNSNIAAYQLLDRQPGSGKWFYRLKLMDIDGHYTYSDIVSAAVDCGAGEIKVYPTVAASEVQVLLPAGYEQAHVALFNMLGQMVNAPVSGSGNQRIINIQSLPRASYLVQVVKETTIKVIKIIKE